MLWGQFQGLPQRFLLFWQYIFYFIFHFHPHKLWQANVLKYLAPIKVQIINGLLNDFEFNGIKLLFSLPQWKTLSLKAASLLLQPSDQLNRSGGLKMDKNIYVEKKSIFQESQPPILLGIYKPISMICDHSIFRLIYAKESKKI